jgi:hypothetical protein
MIRRSFFSSLVAFLAARFAFFERDDKSTELPKKTQEGIYGHATTVLYEEIAEALDRWRKATDCKTSISIRRSMIDTTHETMCRDADGRLVCTQRPGHKLRYQIDLQDDSDATELLRSKFSYIEHENWLAYAISEPGFLFDFTP